MSFQEAFPLFSQLNFNWFGMDTWLAVLVIIVVVAFVAISIIWGIRAHRAPVSFGRENLVGRKAVVDTPLNPEGMVFIEGERWKALLDEGTAKPGEKVIITRVEGLELWVTRKGIN